MAAITPGDPKISHFFLHGELEILMVMIWLIYGFYMVFIWLMMVNNNLVGGWYTYPSEK